METRNTSEEKLTGEGRSDQEPPAGYGGQEEIAKGEAGKKQGQVAQPEVIEDNPPASER